ncbi:MAG: hypothetical protein L6R43_07360 [Planctomycetes bacterium]|nr:hypothetical protein [Planctomycetota bacterium]
MGPPAPAALLAALLALPLLVQEPPPAPAPAPSPPPAPAPSERTPVGRVVAAVAAAALGNAALPEKERVAGDALLDLYVRAAARAAAGDARSFLLGIGHAVDPTRSLEKTSLLSKHYAGVESEEERKARLGAIGKPTLRGRNDHALHFLVSAAFARALGGAAAETLGLSKEMMDAMKVKGSGLSFADLAADYAGIRFDAWLADAKEGAARLARVAEGFRGAEFLPDVSGEVEGLTGRPRGAGRGARGGRARSRAARGRGARSECASSGFFEGGFFSILSSSSSEVPTAPV